MHFVGAFLAWAFCILWQSMQVPDWAVGLWNAPCRPVFIPGRGGFVWQSKQDCWAALAGFSVLDA